jgi:hypothetical protein
VLDAFVRASEYHVGDSSASVPLAQDS